MEAYYAGWLSILPPIIAIVLALVTKEVLTSLMCGILTGTLIYTVGVGLNPIVGTVETAFNVMVDDAALKPVTKGYRWVTPQFVQDGVSNAIDNLGEVNNTLNNVLQGKVDQGITSAFRFMLNSTIGVFGLFDVATWVGMERAPEDFGQTLGVWGVPEGPYFELPLLGPSGGRDIFKWPVQTATNPITYLTWDEWEWSTAYAVVDAVDTRSRMMDAGLDDMRANVVDEYVAIRDAYRQSRRMAVADGQIDEDAQLNSLTPLSFDDEEAEDDAGKPAETDKEK